MCLFPEENQQPVLRGHVFPKKSVKFSLDVKQKHTFCRRKSTEKIAKVSSFINYYSFRILKPFNNTRHTHDTRHTQQQHTTHTTTTHTTTHNTQHTTHNNKHNNKAFDSSVPFLFVVSFQSRTQAGGPWLTATVEPP